MSPQLFSTAKETRPDIGMEVLILRCSEPEMECVIAPGLGFNLISWSYRGKELVSYDPAELKKPMYTGCPVLFPFPNRVRNAQYTFGGRSYRQVKDGTPIVLHSLVWDEPFQYKLTAAQGFARAEGIIRLDTPRMLEGYPFPCTLTLVCELNAGGLSFDYTVSNDGTAPMPFGFAIHPYFVRVDGDATQVRIPAAKVYENTPDLLPTGKVTDTKGTRYDLSTPSSTAGVEFDDVFCDLSGPCSILHPQSGIGITLAATPDFQHIVYYSTKTMPRLFCVENQTCSTDAINIHETCKTSNLLTLAPGKCHNGRVDFLVASLPSAAGLGD